MTWIVQATVPVSAPPDRVFGIVTDSAHAQAWVPELEPVTDVDGEGPGKTWRWRVDLEGVALEGVMRTTLWLEGQRVRSESIGDVRSTWDWRMTATEDGVELSLKVQIIPPVAAVRVHGGPKVAHACERLVQDAVARVRALAESEPITA